MFFSGLGGAFKLGEFLATVPKFIACMAPVSNSHGSVFAFFVDRHLMIGVRLAFGAVRSHLFWGFHDWQPEFRYVAVRVLFIVDGRAFHFPKLGCL